jgi:hypothetical protein
VEEVVQQPERDIISRNVDEKVLAGFSRQVRNRSRQHKIAIGLLYANNLYTPALAMLRQELDSLIRLEYLLSRGDRAQQEQLIESSVTGKAWTEPAKRNRVTDRTMVEAARMKLPWSALVYEIGCSFVHLSNLHDYQQRKPAEVLSKDKLDELIRYLTYYHGGLLDDRSTFEDLFDYVPRIFEKVSDNVERRLEDLEKELAI